jgi:hypothetical protein
MITFILFYFFVQAHLPVVLQKAKVFEMKGIHPTDYKITFKLADNVPKQGVSLVIVVFLLVYFYIVWHMAYRCILMTWLTRP